MAEPQKDETTPGILKGLNPLTKSRPRAGDPPKRERKERKPVPARKKDLSDGIAAVWAITGAALSYPTQWVTLENGQQMRVAISPAAGRVMTVQAPLAGRELNKWVKDHDAIYRLVEPILGQQGLNVLMSVVAPPLIVAILERKPEAAPLVMPILGPMLFEIWKESKKQVARSEEMMGDLMDEGENVGAEYQTWLEGIGFSNAPPEAMPEPEPEPEPVAASKRSSANG